MACRLGILKQAATGSVERTGRHPRGCTPGYWKQSQHFGSWTDPYDPSDPLTGLFDADALELHGLEDLTLLQALQARGGGANALIRHAVAAVLNAASSDVDFAFEVAAIVAEVNAALNGDADTIEDLKDMLADANEAGCPLGRNE